MLFGFNEKGIYPPLPAFYQSNFFYLTPALIYVIFELVVSEYAYLSRLAVLAIWKNVQ